MFFIVVIPPISTLLFIFTLPIILVFFSINNSLLIVDKPFEFNKFKLPKTLILSPNVIFFTILTPPSTIKLPESNVVLLKLLVICTGPSDVILLVVILNVLVIKLKSSDVVKVQFSSALIITFFEDRKLRSCVVSIRNGFVDTMRRSASSELTILISPSIFIPCVSLPFTVDNTFN